MFISFCMFHVILHQECHLKAKKQVLQTLNLRSIAVALVWRFKERWRFKCLEIILCSRDMGQVVQNYKRVVKWLGYMIIKGLG